MSPRKTVIRLAISTAAVAFATELVVMLVIAHQDGSAYALATLLDALSIAAVVSIAVYFLFLRPMAAQAAARERVEGELRATNDRIEKKIQERTQALLRSNEELEQGLAARERSEQSLRLFRTLIDHSMDAIEVLDPETGRFLEMSERGCSDLGYTHEEALSLTVLDVDPLVDRATFQENVARLREMGSLLRQGTHRRKDGSTFPVEVNIKYVHLDRDYLVTVARDITERRRGEEERFRLATAVEQAVGAIVITDLDGKILYVNPAFEKATGYSRSQVLGENPRILKSGRQSADFYRQMWRTLRAGDIWTGRFVNKRKDGSLFEAETTITPVRDASGKVINFVAVEHDVTHEVELEGRLRQAQKMDAVGRLAGGIAHDFNNMLVSIIGHSELALARPDLTGRAREYVQDVKVSGQRAAELTRQLLAFSRKQTREPRRIDLKTHLQDLRNMLRRVIRENIELAILPEETDAVVSADPGQFDQVVLNLCVNASDAMPEGGKLTIRTASATADETCDVAGTENPGGRWVRLDVADTGTGMSEEVKAHLFEPFFTTKPVGKGTGLGLSVVYGIVQQSGGHIEVESEPGAGTTFRIYLPAADAADGTPTTGRAEGILARGTETILLAEDEEVVRTLVQEILSGCGYRVIAAANGEEAAQQPPDGISLLISDVIMPGMNGRDLAERLHAERPGLRAILMTGYVDPTSRILQGLPPWITLVQKPFSPQALAARVRACLDTSLPPAKA